MSAYFQPNAQTFKLGSAETLSRGMVVKPGADNAHVRRASSATTKNFGIALNDSAAAEDKVEVALPGGGAPGLLGGTVAFGDLLASDANGKLVATTTANDRVVAVAMEDGVANDIIAVHVVVSNV